MIKLTKCCRGITNENMDTTRFKFLHVDIIVVIK